MKTGRTRLPTTPKHKKSPKPIQWLTRGALAAAMDVNELTVDRWRQQGMPRTGERKQYNLAECFAWRIARAEEQGRASAVPSNTEDARLRKAAAEADLAEFDLARKREQLLTVEEFDEVMADGLNRLRAYGQGIPARWAAQGVGLTSKLKVRQYLQRIVVEMFEQFHRADESTENAA